LYCTNNRVILNEGQITARFAPVSVIF